MGPHVTLMLASQRKLFRMLYSICYLKLPFMSLGDDTKKIRIVKKKKKGKGDGKSICPNRVEAFSGY